MAALFPSGCSRNHGRGCRLHPNRHRFAPSWCAENLCGSRGVQMTQQNDRRSLPARYSRRGFLARAGAGASALALGGSASAALARSFVGTPARSRFVSTDWQHFGRLVPDLPPFAPSTEGVKKSLRALGAQGGPLDAQDELSAGPIELIVNASRSANHPDNPGHTACTTFVGQFIDHDVTFDTSSPLGRPIFLSSPNGRMTSAEQPGLLHRP